MRNRWIVVPVAFAAALAGSSAAAAAASKEMPNEPPKATSRTGPAGMDQEMMHGMMHDGMMHDGMMGMMGMMGQCQRMMSGGMAMPQLPPGNEKLQLQMQAEMMQRMGETLAKYADKIKEKTP